MPVLFSRTFLLGKALLYTGFGMASNTFLAQIKENGRSAVAALSIPLTHVHTHFLARIVYIQ